MFLQPPLHKGNKQDVESTHPSYGKATGPTTERSELYGSSPGSSLVLKWHSPLLIIDEKSHDVLGFPSVLVPKGKGVVPHTERDRDGTSRCVVA